MMDMFYGPALVGWFLLFESIATAFTRSWGTTSKLRIHHCQLDEAS
jgi:hypothetical protein